VNFNNKITKISRIYAHQKKNRISKNFLIFLSKNGEISPEKKKHDLRGFGLVFSVRWFALGSGQAAAFFSFFFWVLAMYNQKIILESFKCQKQVLLIYLQ
jgi:hypothetical protein